MCKCMYARAKDTLARLVGVGEAGQHGAQHAGRVRAQPRARQLAELLDPRDRRQLNAQEYMFILHASKNVPTFQKLPAFF